MYSSNPNNDRSRSEMNLKRGEPVHQSQNELFNIAEELDEEDQFERELILEEITRKLFPYAIRGSMI